MTAQQVEFMGSAIGVVGFVIVASNTNIWTALGIIIMMWGYNIQMEGMRGSK
jgi:hypothetical protein